jgi:hypothetical protein
MAPIFTGFRMGFGRVDPEPSDAGAGFASGGVVYSNVTISGTNYNVHRFISSGAFTISSTSNNVRILVVGGGGAGGSFNPGSYGGGGGGAGGVRYIPTITLSSGTYPVTVGPGGTGGNPYNPPINAPNTTPNVGAGVDSVFNSPGSNGVPAIRASGGGAGGGGGVAGGSGGSGGGKSYPGPSVAPGNAGGNDPRSNPISEGNPSETLKTSFSVGSYGCGGGGGAGSSPSPWQTGSAGITLSGVGTPGDPWLPPAGNIFGGGGGGSSYRETDGNGAGGSGGGGPAPGGPGITYTGGGGGGRGLPSGSGGNGGPGVVYVIIPSAYIST